MLWVNDNGPGEVCKFWFVGGRLFAFSYTGAPMGNLYERTGPAAWTVRNVGLPPAGAYDVVRWNSLWWAISGNVYSTTDPALGWNLAYAPPPIAPRPETLCGYGSYLYVVYMEMVGMIYTTAHFLRYSTAGGWQFDFIPSYVNPNPWPNSLNAYDFVGYGGVHWFSADEQGTGYFFRYYDGAWHDYHTNLEAGLFLYHAGDMYFTSATLDQVWRKDGAADWALKYAPTDGLNLVNLSETGGDLWVGGEAGGNIRAHAKRGGVWQPATVVVADGWAGGAIQCGYVAYLGGLANIWRGSPEYNVSPVGGGLHPQGMAADADGDNLYLGLYNALGQPLLVRVPLPLTPTTLGTAVFAPGAGDAIGVHCSGVGGKLAIAGNFGVNEQVQVSENAGLTFVDIDPGTWGANRAQPSLLNRPDGVDELVTFLDANQDAVETFDQGASWQTENPALGFAPTAAAKLPDGDEVVLAENPGQVHYSPNRAHDLAGIAGPADVVALEVT